MAAALGLSQALAWVQRVSKDEAGVVVAMEGVLHLEGSVKSTKLKLTWLPDTDDLVPLTFMDFDHLITKKKIEDEDNIEDLVNPNSVRTFCLNGHFCFTVGNVEHHLRCLVGTW